MCFALLEKDRFYGWVALTTVAVVCALAGGGAVSSFGAFLPSICKDYGWSRALVSGAFTMLMIVMGLSSPLAGLLAEKYGPRRVVVIGSLISVLGLLLLAFHSKVWQLYVGYGFLVGLGSGLGGMVPAATIANNWFRKKIALAMGISLSSVGLGGVVVIPAVMIMINHIGWRSTYLVLSGLMILLGALLPAIFLRNRPEDLGQVPDGIALPEPSVDDAPLQSTSDFTLKEALGTPTFWLLVITLSMMIFLLNMLMTHEVAFLQGIGISAAIAASALGMLMGVNTLGNLIVGVLSLKFKLKRLALMGLFLLFSGMVLVLFTRSLPMVVIYTIVFGFGYGASMVTVMSLLSFYFGRTHYPAIMGAMMLFSAVGNAGPPIAGAVYDATKSYNIAFTIGLAAAAVGLFCMILLKAPLHRAGKAVEICDPVP